jgi:hypothetical protein
MQLGSFGWIEGLVAAVIAIGGGVMAWQRTRSRDGVEAAKDRAEEGLVERLQARADGAEKRADALFNELQELGDQRTEDAGRIALLQAENEYLKRFYRRAMRDMPEEKRSVWETDFAPLGADPPETKR